MKKRINKKSERRREGNKGTAKKVGSSG
jgi:hypothetical protein